MEDAVFITNDKMMKIGGVMDDTDIAILKQCSPSGKPVILNLEEALDVVERENPQELEKMLQTEAEKRGLVTLSKEQFINLGDMANEHYKDFKQQFAGMPRYIAEIVRAWRVDEHYTWRRIAHAAADNMSFRLIFKKWYPPSNQLVGMALCDRAARVLGEDFSKEPWN